MAIFLSVAESLKYWRSDEPYDTDNNMAVSPSYGTRLERCEHKLSNLECNKYVRLDGDNPLEVLVSSRADIYHTDRITTRLITYPLPDNSFYEVYRDVFVCSPELTFLLAATKLQFRSLVALGCELCGTYSIFSKCSSAIKHAQITDTAAIGEYLDCVPKMRGVKLARRALKSMADNSASPRETDVFMQYCMNSKLGSYGLGNVELNSTQPVKGYVRTITGMTEITPDLYWPEHKIAIEYESTENHGAYASSLELLRKNRLILAKDSRRRRTYEAMGILPITITDGEFCSFNDVEGIAHLLARRMGKHGICNDLGTTFRRSELHEWLKIPVENRPDVL